VGYKKDLETALYAHSLLCWVFFYANFKVIIKNVGGDFSPGFSHNPGYISSGPLMPVPTISTTGAHLDQVQVLPSHL